ncbi:hypothetical protein F4778DRAFT_181660 [Xylariomycetidae sp. FL2044]|nr:hypothetical protein F4778DRAFT_181660 [Xylariomycetidae sp. FL2044]
MRPSLRRACAACAKKKHKCDRRTPQCSRCVRRKITCKYTNEPWTTSATTPEQTSAISPESAQDEAARCQSLQLAAGALTNYRIASVDPFDSYPPTRLPRDQVQRLMHSFLHKIAFQYYPLDLSPSSNPFLISWWPLALGDPALFHVSLQTASLDEERAANKGFRISEILMADSVALLRRKVGDFSLALQDVTMNSVITLATIEFGKGNIQVSDMHVEGVKKLVHARGGINAVRQTNPLTARMVSWVSMLIKGCPQFETQNDMGIGDGVPPIPEWHPDVSVLESGTYVLGDLEIDLPVMNVFLRLRNIFHRTELAPLSPTKLHDLTCFVVFRLLNKPATTTNVMSSPICECLRYGILLYMLIIQGSTYYTHAFLADTIMSRLIDNLESLDSTFRIYGSLDVWLIAVGLVASAETDRHKEFKMRAYTIIACLELKDWNDVLRHMESILWLETQRTQDIFRHFWNSILGVSDHLLIPTELLNYLSLR